MNVKLARSDFDLQSVPRGAPRQIYRPPFFMRIDANKKFGRAARKFGRLAENATAWPELRHRHLMLTNEQVQLNVGGIAAT